MATELTWDPYVTHSVPTGLMGEAMYRILSRRFFGEVGRDLTGEVLGETDLDWLAGIRDSEGPAADDAQQLIDAIYQYRRIELNLEQT